MSGIERIRDFVRWLREVESNLGSANAPREALGLHEGSPVVMQRDGHDFSSQTRQIWRQISNLPEQKQRSKRYY